MGAAGAAQRRAGAPPLALPASPVSDLLHLT